MIVFGLGKILMKEKIIRKMILKKKNVNNIIFLCLIA